MAVGSFGGRFAETSMKSKPKHIGGLSYSSIWRTYKAHSEFLMSEALKQRATNTRHRERTMLLCKKGLSLGALQP